MNDDWFQSWENDYVRTDNSDYYRSSLESQFDSYSDNYSDSDYYSDNDNEEKEYDSYPNSGNHNINYYFLALTNNFKLFIWGLVIDQIKEQEWQEWLQTW